MAINTAPLDERKIPEIRGPPRRFGAEQTRCFGLRFDSMSRPNWSPRLWAIKTTKDAFSGGGWLEVPGMPSGIGDVTVASIMSRMDTAHDFRGWDLFFDNGPVTLYLVNTWEANALRLQTTTSIARNEWHHVFFTYDGSGKPAGVHLYIDGREQPTKVLDNTLTGTMKSDARWELGRRFDNTPLKFARYQDVRLYRRALSTEEVARLPWEDNAARFANKPAAQWTQDERNILTTCYFDRADETSQKLKAANCRLGSPTR